MFANSAIYNDVQVQMQKHYFQSTLMLMIMVCKEICEDQFYLFPILLAHIFLKDSLRISKKRGSYYEMEDNICITIFQFIYLRLILQDLDFLCIDPLHLTK